MSPATLSVIEAVRLSPVPIWGLQIIKETGLPSGSVYPILARLESLGILRSEWESEPTRPGARRKIYMISSLEVEAPERSLRSVIKTQEKKPFAPKRGRPGLASS